MQKVNVYSSKMKKKQQQKKQRNKILWNNESASR